MHLTRRRLGRFVLLAGSTLSVWVVDLRNQTIWAGSRDRASSRFALTTVPIGTVSFSLLDPMRPEDQNVSFRRASKDASHENAVTSRRSLGPLRRDFSARLRLRI